MVVGVKHPPLHRRTHLLCRIHTLAGTGLCRRGVRERPGVSVVISWQTGKVLPGARGGLLRIAPFASFNALRHWPVSCSLEKREDTAMLQLMDLANENAALKRELERIRQEAEELQRRLLGADGSTPEEVYHPTAR